MLKTFVAYAAAGLVGCAAPVIVLWIARNSSPDSNPAWSALAVFAGLGLLAALLAALLPRRWLTIAIVVAAPLCIVSLVMFAALAQAGAYFWVWIAVAAGGAAAAFGGAKLGSRLGAHGNPA